MAELFDSPAAAVAGIPDGATVMIGGFGAAGQPVELIEALLDGGATGLVVVNNNAGNGDRGLAALIESRPGTEDHLLVPPAVGLMALRR